MSLLRSETMQHGTLVLPTDRGHDFLELITKKTHIQIVDMNKESMVRQYKKYIQRIDQMERILRFLYCELEKFPETQVIPSDVDNFLETNHGYQLDQVEDTLNKLYVQFMEFRSNNENLIKEKVTAMEEKEVVRSALQSLLPSKINSDLPRTASSSSQNNQNNLNDDIFLPQRMGSIAFTTIAGVVSTSEQDKLERAVFRISRGNAFCYSEPLSTRIVTDTKSVPDEKSVFVVYIQSTFGSSTIEDKIVRLCGAYGLKIYEWPKNYKDAQARMEVLEEVISDKTKALEAYEDFFYSESSALIEVARPGGGSLIDDYRLFCAKEKAIYAALNLFEGAETTLRADCWFPLSEENSIRQLLMTHSSPCQVSAFLLTDKIKKSQVPPTYIRTNEFTSSFQDLVNTYGIPRYKEINPGIFAIITFPFLFGIMYGDIGHALCLLAVAIYLIVQWPQLRQMKGEIILLISGGRYLILLMALFGIYSGFLNSDFFGIGVDLFGSKFIPNPDKTTNKYFVPPGTSPYPFGIDPTWKFSTNELVFTNSFKMKFSVLIGTLHMFLGLFLKCLNCIYFRDFIGVFFDFLPQFLFMFCFVGYMDILILLKWIAPIDKVEGTVNDNKPLIVNTLIEMFMVKESDHLFFQGQNTLNRVLLLTLAVCFPVLLFGKPLLLKWKHRDPTPINQPADSLQDFAVIEFQDQKDSEEDEEKFEFSEVMLHQLIETIEFSLGTVSNTASYLRLWALSLAHQQLSLVFFNMIILNILKLDLHYIVTAVILFFVFPFYAGITFCVMLGIDVLECFLHSLRLQWIEFQNKFFYGDGYEFTPSRLDVVLHSLQS